MNIYANYNYVCMLKYSIDPRIHMSGYYYTRFRAGSLTDLIQDLFEVHIYTI